MFLNRAQNTHIVNTTAAEMAKYLLVQEKAFFIYGITVSVLEQRTNKKLGKKMAIYRVDLRPLAKMC